MLLEPRRLFAAHLMVIVGFALGNLPIAVMDGLGHHNLFGYSRLMRMEEEANLPAFFSALALLLCSVAAFAIRRRLPCEDAGHSAWTVLAVFFAFLGLDEAVMLHETANRISSELALGGLLNHFGVFVYIPVLLWLAVRLFDFWLRQNSHLRAALFIGAFVYVASAIGVELVENDLIARGFQRGDPVLQTAFIVEEIGEMLAVAVFLYAFLRHFATLGGGLLFPLAVVDAGQTVLSCDDRTRSEHGDPV